MRTKTLVGILSFTALCLAFVYAADAPSDKPQYTSDKKLERPANYRDWVFLSSGLGMSYSPGSNQHPMFTNVFVPQWAYQQFLNSGAWPDKTIFVVEERSSQTKGSINKVGNFQTDLMGMGVEVKDASLPDKWAYYNFGAQTKSASANPKEGCFQCHEDHAAVEHSFVQFYPTLKPVAQKFGTYKQDRENVADAK